MAIDTANGIVTAEFKKEDTIKEIKDKILKENSVFIQELSKQLTNSLRQDADFIRNVTTSLPDKLIKDKSFLDVLSTKLAKLPEFVERTRAEAKTAVLQSLDDQQKNIDKEANPELSNALQETLDSKRYFVVVASSDQEDELRDPELITKATSKNSDRSAYICKPKGGNKRSVLLVTKKDFKQIKLPLKSARYIQNEIVAIPRFNTAYILPTDVDDAKTQADNNIFFDTTTCGLVSGK